MPARYLTWVTVPEVPLGGRTSQCLGATGAEPIPTTVSAENRPAHLLWTDVLGGVRPDARHWNHRANNRYRCKRMHS